MLSVHFTLDSAVSLSLAISVKQGHNTIHVPIEQLQYSKHGNSAHISDKNANLLHFIQQIRVK
jgi:hypothetical protein